MNNFCNDCPHLARGKGLLKLYDKMAKPTFFECPQTNPAVVGCITKQTEIPWEEFIAFLRSNGKIVNE